MSATRLRSWRRLASPVSPVHYFPNNRVPPKALHEIIGFHKLPLKRLQKTAGTLGNERLIFRLGDGKSKRHNVFNAKRLQYRHTSKGNQKLNYRSR